LGEGREVSPIPPFPHSGEGGGRGSEGEWVEVRVTDTGPGIPEDVLPHIFEPFYTTKTSGTGLGLAIVKRAIERVGGTIEVRSGDQNGQGTIFTIRLPVIESGVSTIPC
jgi:signal transduction histidine kinase